MKTRALIIAVTVAATGALVGNSAARTARIASRVVTLNLQGGHSIGNRTACGIRHHYTRYGVKRRIGFNGFVSPAPSGHWRVKIKIKHCSHGRFVDWAQFHVDGSHGKFQGAFRINLRGSYFAHAYFYTSATHAVRSDKQYVRIS